MVRPSPQVPRGPLLTSARADCSADCAHFAGLFKISANARRRFASPGVLVT